MAKQSEELGPCIMGCGRDATSPKHHTCNPCYSSCRVWANVKSPDERTAYQDKLMLRMRRVRAIDSKTIVIGTSPYKWKAKAASNVVTLNLGRRQRGAVR